MTRYKDMPFGAGEIRVFETGEVWSRSAWRKAGTSINKNGYVVVQANGRRTTAHRLVLTAFSGPPKPGELARHLDGDPGHNDLGNLVWGTGRENWDDARKHGTAQIGERHGLAKLTEDQVRQIRSTPRRYGSSRDLANEFGVSKTLIQKIRSGEIWKHVDDHSDSRT
jgi:hypothetical protein